MKQYIFVEVTFFYWIFAWSVDFHCMLCALKGNNWNLIRKRIDNFILHHLAEMIFFLQIFIRAVSLLESISLYCNEILKKSIRINGGKRETMREEDDCWRWAFWSSLTGFWPWYATDTSLSPVPVCSFPFTLLLSRFLNGLPGSSNLWLVKLKSL